MTKQLFLLAGAAALSFSGAAMAKPGGGQGGPHGMGGGNPHTMNVGVSHGNPHSTGIGLAGRPSGKVGFGAGGCPPGLAKKAVPCTPPGLAKNQFAVGQRIPSSLGLMSFNALPRSMRSRLGTRVDRRSRFVTSNGTLVSVNPRTRRVERVILMR